MILNNYLRLKAYTSGNTMSVSGDVSVPIGMVNMGGSSTNCGSCAQNGNGRFNTDNWELRGRLSLVVGQGSTEPTVNDTHLASSAMDSISNIVYSVNTGCEDNKLKTVITMSGFNSSPSQFTIREVGVVKSIAHAFSGSAWQMRDVLMVRELLEEPIVVPVNEGFSLTFAWEEA